MRSATFRRDTDDILEDVKNRPAIIEEAKLILEAYQPSTPEQAAMIIYRAFNAYDSFKRRSEEDQTMLVEDWIESLTFYPAYMLKEMAVRWRESDKKGYLPTIGQFIDMLPAKYQGFSSLVYRAKQVAKQEWFK